MCSPRCGSHMPLQSTESTPIVFVLSPGADPAFDVFKLGEEMGYKPGQKLRYMALGQVGGWAGGLCDLNHECTLCELMEW
jgi:hypothetical protein